MAQDRAFRWSGVPSVSTYLCIDCWAITSKVGGTRGGGITLDLWYGKATSYEDDSFIIKSDEKQLTYVEEVIRIYDAVAGANVNTDKSVGLLLRTWRGNSMPFNNVVRIWTEDPVKMFGVLFRPDLQIEKSWSEVTSEMTTITQTVWTGIVLVREGGGYTNIHSVCYRLPFDHCFFASIHGWTRLKCPFPLFVEVRRLLVEHYFCCQKPLKGGLGIPWLNMRKFIH